MSPNILAVKRKEFEKRRRAHYNEFEAVRRARLLMQKDDEEDDDEDDNDSRDGAHGTTSADHGESSQMEVDIVDPDKPSSSKPSRSAASSSTLTADLV